MAGLFSADAWEKVWTFRGTFFLGVEHTLMTAVFALFISLLLGIAFGLMSTGRNKALRAIARVYVEFIQNTPLLLQICFLYYALAFSGNSIGIIATGIIALGVYHGAYVAEVIRAGIEAIPKGQFEAAESQGFDYFQKMYYIILPQSVKIILPPMVNQVVNLVKNTSVLAMVAGLDLMYFADSWGSDRGYFAQAYFSCALLYFVICFPLARLARYLEARAKRLPVPKKRKEVA